MSKEIIVRNPNITCNNENSIVISDEVIEKYKLEKAKRRVGYAASATAVATLFTIGKSFITGSILFMELAIPNVFIVIMILSLFTAAYNKYTNDHEKG